jgi:hypothetical protein
MKKIISLLLVVLLAAVVFTGCAPKAADPATVKVKTGFATITSIAKSKDAGEADGLAQADTMMAVVTVGTDGKIIDCKIDAAQSKANFNSKGEVTTALDTVFKTKNEMGTGYGMKGSSSIGKEWNEQAEGFAQYVIGKTLDEVKGIAVDEAGYAADSDLKAKITVHIGDFINVVAKAVESAKELGATAADKVSLGTATNIAKSKNAGEEDGQIQVYSTYAALTKDGVGKITSCIIDASQSNIKFDATGKITNDITAAVASKNELGENYGMKKASAIGKEWNEQAAAFANYVKGKTASEVAGIAVDEEGLASDTDLRASVTVHIGDFQAAIAKALA